VFFCGGSSSTHRQTGQAPRACVCARECEWESEGARGGGKCGQDMYTLNCKIPNPNMDTHTHGENQ
jgi:hypothetical protein